MIDISNAPESVVVGRYQDIDTNEWVEVVWQRGVPASGQTELARIYYGIITGHQKVWRTTQEHHVDYPKTACRLVSIEIEVEKIPELIDPQLIVVFPESGKYEILCTFTYTYPFGHEKMCSDFEEYITIIPR